MAECSYPRVTHILKEMVLWDLETPWLKSRYLRRGRLVDACASLVASGQTIDDEWFKGHSGETGDDRVDHEECRPYLDGVRAFMAEHDFVLQQYQIEVVNSVERYIGHLDWLGYFKAFPNVPYIIDLKCGPPPPEYITMPRRINPLYVSYRRQTALYKLALAVQFKVVADRACLHLFDGTYQLIKHKDYQTMNAALMMVRSYHDRQQFRSAA